MVLHILRMNQIEQYLWVQSHPDNLGGNAQNFRYEYGWLNLSGARIMWIDSLCVIISVHAYIQIGKVSSCERASYFEATQMDFDLDDRNVL